jgi:hypothetical protein
MRALRAAVLSVVLLGACGGDESAVTPDASGEVDVVEGDTRDASLLDRFVESDGETADVTRDVALDVGRLDAGMDVPRDASSPRDVRDVVDASRVTDVGAQDVPLPGTVAAGETCHALLRRLGLTFTVGPTTRGVVDPVTVTTPINGVRIFSSSYSGSERPLLMDCRLGVALYLLTRELRTRWDVTALAHFGIYNYRVIAGSTTLSQHAYAMAIDLASFRTSGGVVHSVLSDFTMNGRPTCPPRSTTARDRVLKEIACWMYDSRAFNIVLTPNYNADHRDHFHVDLTAGSHFIGAELPSGVDPELDPFFARLIDDE